MTATASRHFAEFQGQGYFGALDGLRALSILLVLGHHVPDATGFFRTLQENGRYGVSLFFIISGFLICTLLLREEQRNGQIALGRFYGRRALRLLPLYYATLAFQAVLVLVLHQYQPENEALFRAKLPSYLFYYSNWLPTAGVGPFFFAWSLAVEEQFYVAFSLLLVVFARQRAMLVTALGAALLFKFGVYQALGNVDTYSTALRILFSYQEPVLWGVLAAFALNQPRIYAACARIFRRGWTLVALATAALGWLVLHPMETQSTWDAELLFVLMTGILIGTVVQPRVPCLSAPILAHIGKISYGIYLLHAFVISAVKHLPYGTTPWICFVLSAAIVIPLATIVYRCFEEPIIRYYKKRFAPAGGSPASPGPIGEEARPA